MSVPSSARHRSDSSIEPIHTINDHQDQVWCVQFSHDGNKLATGSKDTTVRIYETTTFSLLQVLSGHQGAVTYLSWAPDNDTIISCSEDKTARLWDVIAGTLLRVISHESVDPRTQSISCAAFAPDGNSFVTGSLQFGAPLCIWPKDGDDNSKPDYSFHELRSGTIDCAIVDLSEAFLSDYPILDCSTEVSRTLTTITHTSLLIRLLVLCMDKKIRVWNYSNRELLNVFACGDYIISSLTPRPRSLEILVSVPWRNGELWSMSIASGEHRQIFRPCNHMTFVIRSCYAGPNGNDVISGGEDGRIRIWDSKSGHLVEQFRAHTGSVNGVAWSPNLSPILASGGDDNIVQIWRG